MEILLGLIAVCTCVWLPPMVVAAALVARLSARMHRLEQKLAALERNDALTAPRVSMPAPRAAAVAQTNSEPSPAQPPRASEAEAQTLPSPVGEAAPAPPSTSPPPPAAPSPSAAPPAPWPAPPRKVPAPFVWPSPERVAVWLAAGIGGIALILTALFALVTVIERGWLGPSARVAAGLVCGSFAWIGGSWARRRWPWAGSAVAGAGIGTLYGTLYAASGVLYLLSSSVSGASMVAVTAIAMARAVKSGERFVAWLALTGGLLTPWLLSTGENRPVPFFLYLALLAASAVASAARRGWPDLLAFAALGVAFMHAAWAAEWRTASQVPAALFGIGVLSLPFAAAAIRSAPATRRVASLALMLLSLVALPWIVPVSASFYDPLSGLSTYRTSMYALPLSALVVAVHPALLLLSAALYTESSADRVERILLATAQVAILTVVFAIGWSDPSNNSPIRVLGAVGPLAFALIALLIAMLRDRTSAVRDAIWLVGWVAVAGFGLLLFAPNVDGGSLSAGVCALVVAGLLLAAASRHGGALLALLIAAGAVIWLTEPDGLAHPNALLGAVFALLSATVPFGVRRRWDRQPMLAQIASALAPAVAFLPLYRVWKEMLGDDLLGLLPLLLGAVTLAALASLRKRVALAPDSLQLAIFVGVILLCLTASVPLQLEERWLTVAWSLLAAALAWFSSRVRHELVRIASVLLCVAVAVRLLLNPSALSWGGADEGLIVLNWTLYSWGVPLLATLMCARWLPRPGDPRDTFRAIVLPLVLLAVLIGFALVNVEVSHAFQTEGALSLFGVDRMQSMVRSASWALYGMAILSLGLWRDHRIVRLVGFAFVLLAAIKVFGLDLWDLKGFVRVASIGCLALSLIAAAFLFERLVLRSAARPPVET